MTHDTGHVTRYMLHVVGGEHSQNCIGLGETVL